MKWNEIKAIRGSKGSSDSFKLLLKYFNNITLFCRKSVEGRDKNRCGECNKKNIAIAHVKNCDHWSRVEFTRM